MFRYILNFQHIQSLLNFAFTIKRPCKRLIFAWSQLFDYIFKNGNDLHAYYITAYVYFKEGHRCRFPSYINGAALNARHRKDLRSEEHTSELQSRGHLVCRLLLE